MKKQHSATAEFRVPLAIRFAAGANRRSTPVRLDADFGRFSGGRLEDGLTDPHSIRVERRYPNGKTEILPVRFDERLYYGNSGWVAWRVAHCDKASEYFLRFDRRAADGSLRELPYMPAVGVGDELFAQALPDAPIFVPGMHPFPIAADFDGDGTVDLVSTSHYSNAVGMPWAGVFFWKNSGGNASPRFAPPMRLAADGVDVRDPFPETFSFADDDAAAVEKIIRFPPRRDFISEFYIRCDLFDWFGTGRLDLVTLSRDGDIRVYRNTGMRRPDGTPELVLAVRIPLPKCLAPGFPGMRVIDYDGSGRGSILLTGWNVDQALEYGQLLIMHQTGGTPEAPEFTLRAPVMSQFYSPGQTRFTIPADETDWRSLSNFCGERAWCIDYADADGDGVCELLCRRGTGGDRGVIEVWKFTGTREKPVLEHAGLLAVPIAKYQYYFEFRMVRNAAFDGCFIAGGNGGEIRYFRRRRKNMLKPGAFVDAGPLTGQAIRLRPAGYTRPWPIFRPDGLTDLLLGDEPGFLSIARNTGTRGKPVFACPERMTNPDGKVLHFCREAILHDGNLERGCGQLKPCVADWDGDGRPEILTSGNTNRIFLLSEVDFAAGTVGEIAEITVENGAFAWRKGILARDVDGDGVCELLAVNAEQEFCWYKQAGSPTRVREWRKLRFDDGKIITSNDIPPRQFPNPAAAFDFADWSGRGICDLFVSTNFRVTRLVGCDRKMTVFRRPEYVDLPDGPLYLGLHENQVTFADIDADGVPEMLVGAESGLIHVFHRDYIMGAVSRAAVPKNAGPRRK